MKIESELMDKLINKFNQLFISKRTKYLILDKNGNYKQINKRNSSKFYMLNDNHIKNHLNRKETLGVYSGDFRTLFICFDVDFHNPNLAKWYTYKVVDSLISLGIPSKYIYISTSGNKGYHVDVYFNKMISLDQCKAFFELVMEHGQLYSNEGKIEFRPSTQGLKLPLGINFKNKDSKTNKCWYVDYDKNLQPIKNYTYILDVEQINADIVYDILTSSKDLTINDLPALTCEGLEVESNKDYFDINHKPLPIYKYDPNTTIEAAMKLEEEGLTHKGTRHDSLFLLCRLYNHLGYTQIENEQMLYEWLLKQDRFTYQSPLNECKKDIKQIASYIYEKGIGLTNPEKEIKVTYSEMLNILKAKNINDKLIAYSMLIHSKRYANKKGIFYMSYKQMAEATGLTEKTTYRNINKLEELGILEIVERNVNAGNSKNKFKKPNKYRFIEYNIKSEGYVIYNNDYLEKESDINKLLTVSIISLFDTTSLKELLPKNQYYTYKDIMDNSITDKGISTS